MRAADGLSEIDHFFLRTRAPRSLHETFTRDLGLPTAWAYADAGPIMTAGVILGDANVEFLRFKHALRSPRAGLAFTVPSLDASVDQIRRQGFRVRRTPTARQGDTTWNGAFVRRWVGVVQPFLCQYEHDVAERRAEFLRRLHDRGGGTLRVRRVLALSIETTRYPAELDAWRRLLSPMEEVAEGTWTFAAAIPELRLVPAPSDMLVARLFVYSRDAARAAARRAGFDVAAPNVARAVHPDLPGLAFEFVDEESRVVAVSRRG